MLQTRFVPLPFWAVLHAFDMQLTKKQNDDFDFDDLFCQFVFYFFLIVLLLFLCLFIQNFERFYILTFLVKYRKQKIRKTNEMPRIHHSSLSLL